MAEVKVESVKSIIEDKDFKKLYELNCEESGISSGFPDAKWYAEAESLGIVTAFAARIDGKLVGYASLFLTYSPHYGNKHAALDTVFVDPEHRKSGLGARLMLAGIRYAKSHGAGRMVMTARKNSVFYAELKSNPKRFREQHTYFELEV